MLMLIIDLSRELEAGVEVTDIDGNPLGTSRIAPVKGIAQVVISRISMTIPALSK